MSKFPNKNDKMFKARASRYIACYPKTEGYIKAKHKIMLLFMVGPQWMIMLWES